MPDLTILHTNDLHGKLSDRAAERIAREKSTAEHSLLLDGGDAIPSGNIYYRPGGEPILARMSELGYHAMAMGNREFHFLGPGLKSKVKLARFPILCANLHSELELGQLVAPSLVVEVGMKVGVFGLTVPMITKRMMVSKLSPFWFEDPVQAAKELVSELKAKTDLLIALTHIGLKADMELAQTVPGIDIIVGGHTHAVLDKPVLVGETSIVQAGAWGRFLGRVDVNGTRISGKLIDLAE
jgi:2',3'-cyclic-nucleotide 2'-phosphodiesterase (5'-nucleotidase family)